MRRHRLAGVDPKLIISITKDLDLELGYVERI